MSMAAAPAFTIKASACEADPVMQAVARASASMHEGATTVAYSTSVAIGRPSIGEMVWP